MNIRHCDMTETNKSTSTLERNIVTKSLHLFYMQYIKNSSPRGLKTSVPSTVYVLGYHKLSVDSHCSRKIIHPIVLLMFWTPQEFLITIIIHSKYFPVCDWLKKEYWSDWTNDVKSAACCRLLNRRLRKPGDEVVLFLVSRKTRSKILQILEVGRRILHILRKPNSIIAIYSFKIFPHFWLVKTKPHTLFTKTSCWTKFGKDFVILNQWRQKFCHIEPMTLKWCQKCSPLQVFESLTEKTWVRGCVIFGEQKNKEWNGETPIRMGKYFEWIIKQLLNLAFSLGG